MKLHVRNLGRIKQAEIDLRPLTVFIGPNNTNKTWTAFAAYGLVQSLSRAVRLPSSYSAFDRIPGFVQPRKIQQAVKSAAADVVENLTRLSRQKDKTAVVRLQRETMLADVVPPSSVSFSIGREGLSKLLAVEETHVRESKATLEVSSEILLRERRFDQFELELAPGTAGLSIAYSGEEGHSVSRRTLGRALEEKELLSTIETSLSGFVCALFRGAMAFPAERNGLTAVGGFLADRSRESGTLSTASVDFVDMVRLAGQYPKRPAASFVRPFEQHVLGGSINVPAPGTPYGLTYALKDGPAVRLNAASSMIRSLAGLYVYLLKFAEPGQLIVIDEPEINAHPEAQLKLVEFLAMLVDRGFKVLLTTHSPYVVDHVSNLMEYAGLPKTKRKRRMLKTDLCPEGLKPDDVGVYLFDEHGEVHDAIDREEDTIDLSTFSDASDYVGNLYSQILALRS